VSPKSFLAGVSRDGLLRRVEALRLAEAARGVRRQENSPSGSRATDFTTLPGYDEFLLHRAIADKVGVTNPFFRLHEARAGVQTRIGGRALLNFSSYDYLGLNGHPEVIAASKAAIDQYGISASASRCVAGERPIHLKLEKGLADHYGVEASVVFVSGYSTNVGVIGQLVGPKDLLVLDSVVHNSAVMGAVLSGANRRTFPHNDLGALDELLTQSRGKYERALIVVEGLYSMDGDFPDLPRLIEIKKRHDAWLMVDEAHALGVLGKNGRGIAEHFGVDGRDVDIWMGTLSKTLAACGGFIAGSGEMVDYVKCLVGSFVYSAAMPPVIAAAADKALEIMHREPERVRQLQHNAEFFGRLAKERGLNTGAGNLTAVAPIIVGDSLPAALLSDRLFQRGVNVMPVLYPAVPAKSSRLRFFLTSAHSEDDIRAAIDATVEELQNVKRRMGELRLPSAVSDAGRAAGGSAAPGSN